MKPLGFSVDEIRCLLHARDAVHDPSAASSEREAATQRLSRFADVAAERCEELSEHVQRASDLARRLRREARGPDPRSGRGR